MVNNLIQPDRELFTGSTPEEKETFYKFHFHCLTTPEVVLKGWVVMVYCQVICKFVILILFQKSSFKFRFKKYTRALITPWANTTQKIVHQYIYTAVNFNMLRMFHECSTQFIRKRPNYSGNFLYTYPVQNDLHLFLYWWSKTPSITVSSSKIEIGMSSNISTNYYETAFSDLRLWKLG